MHTNVSENLKGNDHMEDEGTDRRIIREGILEKWGGMVMTRCIWLRKGTSDRLL
jgi:hypothetical protein